jgi:hypothetical protein
MTTPAATTPALDRLAQNIAERVVAILRDQPVPQPGELVDAATLARVLGVTRDFIYAHAVELGGRRLGDVGDGKRPRWRFDVDAAR